MAIALAATLSAQAAKPAGTKSVMHDITITAEDVYTGTMEMATDAGKVTGKLILTSPTPITGDVKGTSKAGALALEFGFHMVEQNCDGTVKMNIQLPETPGIAKGTMEAVGCGRDEANKVIGTVELKPAEPKTPKH
jgi:hypothetical protein